jgi:hypothetical protein
MTKNKPDKTMKPKKETAEQIINYRVKYIVDELHDDMILNEEFNAQGFDEAFIKLKELAVVKSLLKFRGIE